MFACLASGPSLTSVLGAISATTSAFTRRSMNGPSTPCRRASWCLSSDIWGAEDPAPAPPAAAVVLPCKVRAARRTNEVKHKNHKKALDRPWMVGSHRCTALLRAVTTQYSRRSGWCHVM